MTQTNTLSERTRRASLPLILLALMILAYAGFFSAYTLQRHATLNTFAADLSFIDQPMWNTIHGRFLERTLGAIQAPRLAEHFEPILIPLSLIYVAWDDARAILILQTLALAVGALPVFWIARRAFTGVTGEIGPADTRRAEWIGLAFSASYLLFPALQAANVADFHADPLAVAPLLFAFWYGSERRWRAMWFWAVVVMAAKETLPTLMAMLGLVLIITDPGFRAAFARSVRLASFSARLRAMWSSPTVRHGLALVAVSVAWYFIATFLIVAPLARQYYGASGPIYFDSRYGFAGGMGGLLALLREPARLAYLTGLFASVGWLALLAPEYLLLGLPVLVANILSGYPGQYSGEQHYSAPLVAALIIAAIYGARRLQRFLEKQIPFRFSPLVKNSTLISALIVVWLLVFAVAAQRDRGWTPLARPFSWPVMTEHHRTLPRLLGQVPAEAAVSATPAVHAHLAHREKIYVYPELGDATHVLIDVAGVTDMQAGDVRASVTRLLDAGWGVVDAADGFLLLQRGLASGQANTALPEAFFSFTRVTDPQPQIPVKARFGPLTLLGYDIVDDERFRLTRFRFYFEVTGQPSPDLTVRYEARSSAGEVVDDAKQRPMPSLTWLPASQWQQGDILALETVPWFLPRSFAPVLRVESGGQVAGAEILPAPAQPQLGPMAPPAPELVTEVAPDGALRLPGMARREGRLELWEGPLYPVEPVDAAFGGEDWTVRLREWSAPLAVAPGGEFPVLFYWQAPRAAPKDYNVFVHLRDATGRTVAQEDGPPTLFVDRPATRWAVGEDGLAGGTDAHLLRVPADAQPGQYEVVVGWYDWETGRRLRRTGGAGVPSSGEIDRNAAGDEFVLGLITVDPMAAPRPDTPCLMAKEACASLE